VEKGGICLILIPNNFLTNNEKIYIFVEKLCPKCCLNSNKIVITAKLKRFKACHRENPSELTCVCVVVFVSLVFIFRAMA
jgi:hypothetical protein